MIIHIESLLGLYPYAEGTVYWGVAVPPALWKAGGTRKDLNGRTSFTCSEIARTQYAYLSLEPEDLPMICAIAKPRSLGYIVAQKILAGDMAKP